MKKIFFLLLTLIFVVSCEEKTEIPIFEKSTITDIDGNEYAVAKIGNQWWMIENLKSVTYDTQSRLSGTTIIPSTAAVVFTPYHTKTTATSISLVGGVNFSANLTAQHREKIGYLYNWAAALGLPDGQVDTVFVEKQQGICPNGWHVPTKDEWAILTDYITKNAEGKFKTTFGWFDNNKPVLESPIFAVLPGGYSQGRTIKSLGFSGNFTSSTSENIRSASALSFNYKDDVILKYNEVKSYGTSVRCVKD